MIRVSYNLSPVLKDTLSKIEALRQKIILTPLPPQIKLRIRWETNLDRIYWAVAIKNETLSRSDIVKLLTNPSKKRLTEAQKIALRYKRGLDYVSQNWLISNKDVAVSTILNIHKIAGAGRLVVSEAKIKEIFDYIQASPENPVIQAAIIYIQLDQLNAFSQDNEFITQLVTCLFLYKWGYDFRGFLLLEETWKRDFSTLKEVVETTLATESLTLWLTYFSKTMINQLEKVTANLSSPDLKLDYLPTHFWELNNRQREILTLLEEPKRTITNREVQKQFKVSQITASRDLAKLTSLRLLFTHGNGRSIRYTKV